MNLAPHDHLDDLYRSPAGILLCEMLSQARLETQNPRSTKWQRKAATALYEAMLGMSGDIRSAFSGISYEMAGQDLVDELADYIAGRMDADDTNVVRFPARRLTDHSDPRPAA